MRKKQQTNIYNKNSTSKKSKNREVKRREKSQKTSKKERFGSPRQQLPWIPSGL